MAKKSGIKLELTDRGFAYGEFQDQYGSTCSIQESSLATDYCIWLGTESDRMHLNRRMVADLLPYLQHFVETGRLPEAKAKRGNKKV